MALWGNNDNRTAQGTVTLDYSTGICTGSNQEAYGAGTQFGESGTLYSRTSFTEISSVLVIE